MVSFLSALPPPAVPSLFVLFLMIYLSQISEIAPLLPNSSCGDLHRIAQCVAVLYNYIVRSSNSSYNLLLSLILSMRVLLLNSRGWSGGAMVLGKLPVPGRPTVWITVGQGPTALAVGAGGGCLDIFSLIYPFFPLSPSLWETARYGLKYCLKGPLSPKPTNQNLK